MQCKRYNYILPTYCYDKVLKPAEQPQVDHYAERGRPANIL